MANTTFKIVFHLAAFLLLMVGCIPKEESGMANDIDNEIKLDDGIIQTIDNLYSSIDYDSNLPPDWEMFQSVFVEGANLMDVKDTTVYRYNTSTFTVLTSKLVHILTSQNMR